MIDPPDGLRTLGGVVGVGIDVVEVARIERAILRTERFAQRVFTATERSAADRGGTSSLAARFAAKEAVLKSLGLGVFEVPLRDIEVTGGGDEPPSIRLHGEASQRAIDAGVSRWLVSLSHDGGVAAAIVVACGGVTPFRSD